MITFILTFLASKVASIVPNKLLKYKDTIGKYGSWFLVGLITFILIFAMSLWVRSCYVSKLQLKTKEKIAKQTAIALTHEKSVEVGMKSLEDSLKNNGITEDKIEEATKKLEEIKEQKKENVTSKDIVDLLDELGI